MKSRKLVVVSSVIAIGILFTAACAAVIQGKLDLGIGENAEEMKGMMDDHMSGGQMPGGHLDHSAADHMTGPHAIPEEAAEVPNPVPLSEASIAAGETIYATHCAVCHGESGRGDGPTAASLAMQPADLHAGHVQDLTDGALFYVITNGRVGTPMAAWGGVLDEDQRWTVVNFLRTFRE